MRGISLPIIESNAISLCLDCLLILQQPDSTFTPTASAPFAIGAPTLEEFSCHTSKRRSMWAVSLLIQYDRQ